MADPLFDPEHERKTRWSGGVLYPLWILQILCTIFCIGSYIYLFTIFTGSGVDYFESYPDRQGRASFVYISSVILVILDFIVLGVIGYQMFLFHKSALPAKKMLIMQIGLNVFWWLCFLIEMLGLFGVLNGGIKTILDLCATIPATGFTLGTLIYSSIIYHRRQKRIRDTETTYDIGTPSVKSY